ncbi:entry exclusion protein TrbK [Ensifer sp. MPMI2T]|nr:entry exclusion protein TrbK [Ensifer sp. MPMI2T]
MVRAKLTLIAIATILTIGSASIWFIIAEFVGSSKDYPTSGGQKVKVEW